MNYRSEKTVNLMASIHRISTITSFLVILALIFATLAISRPVLASDLDDFETAATSDDGSDEENEGDENDESNEENQAEQHYDFFSFFFQELFEGFINVVFSTLYEQAQLSFVRIDGSTDEAYAYVEIREIGDPTLPFFQMDTRYLFINPELHALDQRFEVGVGAIGFEYRNTRFSELNPYDKLSLSQYHVLLRFSATGALEYGIGMGTVKIRGNEQNYGFSVTYPIKIYPSESLGIKFKPTYGWINDNCIEDYDVSVLFSQKFGSLELGYRYLEVNGVNLGGKYIGLALHY